MSAAAMKWTGALIADAVADAVATAVAEAVADAVADAVASAVASALILIHTVAPSWIVNAETFIILD